MRRFTVLALALLCLAQTVRSLHVGAKFLRQWNRDAVLYGRIPIKRSIVGLGGRNGVLGGGRGGGEEGGEGFLSIRDAPPKFVEARQHGKVVLECSASGSPAPTISWFKDGRRLFKEGASGSRKRGGGDGGDGKGESMGETKSKVALECLGERDAGLYECVASNGREKTSVATELNVASFQATTGCKNGGGGYEGADEEEKKPVINQYMESYMQLIGRDALLLCRAHGPHETYWMAPNQVQIDLKSDKYQMTSSGDLIVRGLSFEDMGMFQCLVKSPNGHDAVETFVYPLAVS